MVRTRAAAKREARPKAPRGRPSAEQPSSRTADVTKRTTKKRSFEEIEDDNRPPPQGTPPVYATKRGDMCETLSYFRQYQGGIYTGDGFIQGSLLAQDNGERPYVDDELVLTRAGGGMGIGSDEDESGALLRQIKDHDPESACITGFLNNVEYKIAAPIILGQECKHCPAKPAYPYSVMTHFKAVYLWWEKSNNKKVARFRYEKLYLDEQSWWVPEGFQTRNGPPDYHIKAKRQICKSCKEEHPLIFNEGFVCVNHTCKQFWMLGRTALTNEVTLTYNPVWLSERTEWPAEIKPPFALRPKLLPSDEIKDPLFTTMRASLKGTVCPKCHCCIPRKDFLGWSCEIEGCGFSHELPRIKVTIESLQSTHATQFHGHAIPRSKFLQPFQRRASVLDGPWRVETYDVLPGCLVKQFHSNMAINEVPGGADDMLGEMTRADLGLKRRPMTQSVLAGQLTGHYSANYGMPYKFSAEVETTPFSGAPDVIMKALHRMIWAGNKASEDAPLMKLNEVLVLGYFKDQQIGFHDDGEKEAGPTVVTFSLGSSARMLMRMKPKFFFGCRSNTPSSKSYDINQKILPGCWKPEERRRLNKNWSKWTIARQATEFRAFKDSFKGKKPPISLDTELRHGDFIVMQGDDSQRCFEHQISNLGDVRFALTARHVRPDVLVADGYSSVDLQGGEYVTSESDVYSGDMNAFDGRRD